MATKAELKTKIDTEMPDNTQGQITEAVMRDNLKGIIDNMAHVDDIPETHPDRKGIRVTADVGDGPVITIPKEVWEDLGTDFCSVQIIDENGYVVYLSPRFVPAETPTELQIDFGVVLTSRHEIHLS